MRRIYLGHQIFRAKCGQGTYIHGKKKRSVHHLREHCGSFLPRNTFLPKKSVFARAWAECHFWAETYFCADTGHFNGHFKLVESDGELNGVILKGLNVRLKISEAQVSF
jgi:hypothetical protein